MLSFATIANAKGNIKSLPSIVIAINNLISYFPQTCVPSIDITGGQCTNPSMHGLKAKTHS